ncbi:HAD-like domain-containing protein [Chytriomyces sp. MP71]|nr:HAD-like domain-containing protein [Chytriomyces sp. MP71]
MPPKAVIFDIGGVVVSSPLESIRRYEAKLGLPVNYINVAIKVRGADGAFQRFERGEVSLIEAAQLLTAELNDAEFNTSAYTKMMEGKATMVNVNVERIKCIRIDGNGLLRMIMKHNVDPLMGYAVRTLKASGRFKVAALTNNFALPEDAVSSEDKEVLKALQSMFDFYIESSLVGLRKPDPAFFLHACKVLEVQPHECIFLDDIGDNLKAARALKMQTIRVIVGRVPEAISELEKLTGLSLSLPAKL